MTSKASSSSATSSRAHKRKWTRQQLLRQLEILNSLAEPLPPTLPPSPPASRSSSPAPGSKRKADVKSDQEHTKRPRTGSFSNQPSHTQSRAGATPVPLSNSHPRASTSTSSYMPKIEPCEDGEVREDPPPQGNPVNVSNNVPVRRPRRGMPSIRHFDYLHDHYHSAGRKLKYSGDARFWSTFPPTHKEYRSLSDPPPPNSPYHKHGGLIAKLELVDALVCFTYALWSRDYKQRSCNKDTWRTIEGFLVWCKNKWQIEDNIGDAEKAFFGLICMIESFIQARKAVYLAKYLDADMDSIATKAASSISEAISSWEEKPSDPNAGMLGIKAETTPQMLPSPASIAPANSANSTPTNRDGTPSTKSDRSSSAVVETVKPGPPVPGRLLPTSYTQSGLPIPAHVIAAANTVTVPVGPQMIGSLKDLTSSLRTGATATSLAQQYLTLPIMARWFPRTFSRMIYSSLGMTEEHEPDIEDDEGELLWPGQGINGEGLGWVCLMGQAMIREFGKQYGYKGLAGVVPKPEIAEDGPQNAHRLPHRPSTAAQR